MLYGSAHRKAHVQVLLTAEPADGNERINVFQHRVEEASVPPELGRPLAVQGTGKAAFVVAGNPVKFPQYVHGAHQPVLVHGIELDAGPVAEGGGAYQRHIVVIDYIELTFVQYLTQTGGLQSRVASLLGDQRREHPRPALEAVDGDVGMVRVAALGTGAPGRYAAVGVDAVHYLDMMPLPGQGVGQPVDEHSIAAEEVGRIECGDHAKSKRS
jgi:hypothetical protein